MNDRRWQEGNRSGPWMAELYFCPKKDGFITNDSKMRFDAVCPKYRENIVSN